MGAVAPKTIISGVERPVSRCFYGTANKVMLAGENANHLLDEAMACGINAFDTARSYGQAEKSLGEWMKARGNREQVVVLSKCGDITNGVVCVNRKVIEEQLATSLRTLQTDYIDLYLLHRDDPNTPVSEIIDTLNDAYNAGKIKVLGVSNWTHQRIEEANAYAKENGLKGFEVSSPHFGLANQVQDPWGGNCVTITGDNQAEARAWYRDNQMPVIAYSSLARGFFSGLFKSDDIETARKVLDGFAQKGFLYDVNLRKLAKAEELARKYDTTVTMIALRYLFSTDMNVYSIVSSTRTENISAAVESTLCKLSSEDMAYLEE